jgi:phosphoserine phosphatase RsbU/P
MKSKNQARSPVAGATVSSPRVQAVGWMTAAFLMCLALGQVPGVATGWVSWLEWLLLLAIVIVGTPVLYRHARGEMLWRLRNKLTLTYLLIGLAPVVLFCALFGLAAYVAAGQFAIHLVTARMEGKLDRVAMENTSTIAHIANLITGNKTPPTEGEIPATTPEEEAAALPIQTAVFLDGRPVGMHGAMGHARTPLWLPQWFLQGKKDEAHALVLDGDHLSLAAIDRRRLPSGRTLIVIGSVPVDRELMGSVAEDLGSASVVPGLSNREGDDIEHAPGDRLIKPSPVRESIIAGGEMPPKVNLGDLTVRFFSTVPTLQWDDGTPTVVPLNVQSRPSVLYRQLFGAALTGRSTSLLQFVFLAVCVFFAVLEVFALWMARRLSRTVTESVEALYDATVRIDQGDLKHRIDVRRTDQVADLCSSFNRMSSSLERLLEEQAEKERLQSELSIAQEVQANLFPVAELWVPGLDLYGVCRPARSVSGDYYDFLVFHGDAQRANVPTGVGIALGDISGKGISAALLMANLHSAVRAYRFATEELVYSSSALSGLNAPRGEDAVSDGGEVFESPGKILALLNRHLYRSTQPEKYATLFLAHYNVETSKLICSNAGHLPPIVLCSDGSVRRLTKGGTVVGLMDGMHYDEETVTLSPGDLLIAFSDGVTEPENDFGEFGEERLIEVVYQLRDQPLATIAAQVLDALDAWIGAEEQPDDITLVLARA